MFFRQCAVFKLNELREIVNSYEEGQNILIYIDGWSRVIFKDKTTKKEIDNYSSNSGSKTVYAIISDYLSDYVGKDVKISGLSYRYNGDNEIEVTFE